MAHTYIKSSLWHKEKIKDPYKTISDVFNFAEINLYRKTIKHFLLFAEEDKPYDKKPPGYFLQNLEQIEAIINAASLINKENVNLHKSKPRSQSNGKQVQEQSMDWNSFPRSLSTKEYNNPHLVIRNFFRYLKLSEWKQCLKSILELSLTEDNIRGSMLEINTLSIYLHLTKLVESVYLIHETYLNTQDNK